MNIQINDNTAVVLIFIVVFAFLGWVAWLGLRNDG
jgi:hypothetical protein